MTCEKGGRRALADKHRLTGQCIAWAVGNRKPKSTPATEARTTSFSEGDFNGDGRFDQLDIVAALETGGYLREPSGEDNGLFTHGEQCFGDRDVGSQDAVLGDLDGDGDLDSSVGNYRSNDDPAPSRRAQYQ